MQTVTALGSRRPVNSLFGGTYAFSSIRNACFFWASAHCCLFCALHCNLRRLWIPSNRTVAHSYRFCLDPYCNQSLPIGCFAGDILLVITGCFETSFSPSLALILDVFFVKFVWLRLFYSTRIPHVCVSVLPSTFLFSQLTFWFWTPSDIWFQVPSFQLPFLSQHVCNTFFTPGSWSRSSEFYWRGTFCRSRLQNLTEDSIGVVTRPSSMDRIVSLALIRIGIIRPREQFS